MILFSDNLSEKLKIMLPTVARSGRQEVAVKQKTTDTDNKRTIFLKFFTMSVTSYLYLFCAFLLKSLLKYIRIIKKNAVEYDGTLFLKMIFY